MEVVESGDITLLYLKSKNRFFIEDTELVEITKDNFTEKLKGLSPNCARKWTFQTRRRELSLFDTKFIVEAFNKGKCYNIPFSHVGINVVYGKSNLHLKKLNQLAYQDVSNESVFPGIGIYMENSLPGYNYLKLTQSISYYKFDHEYSASSRNRERHFSISQSGLNISIMPKIELNTNRIRPYLMAGPDLYINLMGQSLSVVDFYVDHEYQHTETSENPIDIPRLSLGASFGGGVKFFYMPNRFIALELGRSTLINSTAGFSNSIMFFSFKTNLIVL